MPKSLETCKNVFVRVDKTRVVSDTIAHKVEDSIRLVTITIVSVRQQGNAFHPVILGFHVIRLLTLPSQKTNSLSGWDGQSASSQRVPSSFHWRWSIETNLFDRYWGRCFRHTPQFAWKYAKQSDNFVIAANGNPISTYGTQLLTVSLGLRRVFSHYFILATVNRPIIGADFLATHGLLLDLKRKRLIDPLTGQETTAVVAVVDTPTPKNYQMETNSFSGIVKQYPCLVEPPNYKAPIHHTVTHSLETKGPLPFSKPQSLDAQKHKIAQAEFQHMLDLGIYKVSSS